MTVNDLRTTEVPHATAPAARPAQRSRWYRPKLRTRESLFGAALVIPSLAVFAVVVLWPLVNGVWLGFHDVNFLTLDTEWVGLENLREVIADEQLRHAIWLSVLITVISVSLQIVLGLGVAMLLNQQFYGRSIVRGLVIFPYLLPVVVAMMIWRWMLNDTYGLVNHLLITFGITDDPVLWLSSSTWALPTVIGVSVWRLFPFIVIAVLGRLQTIPQQLYDAAKTDGATAWGVFKDITLPQLRSVLVVIVFLRLIWDFNDFNIIALLTGGGPARSTETLPLLIHRLGLVDQKLGLAAAAADVALVLLTIFFALYFWWAKPFREERA